MKASSPLVLILMAVGIIYAFSTPPAANFREPELARIIFFHVPCAMVSAWLVIWSAVCGVSFLRTKKAVWDERLAASLELAMLYSVLTITTGIVFSKVQWGEWWHWDERQTSYLIVVLMTSGAVALRAAQSDDAKRAASSAAYAIGMVVPAIFLTFVFPRINAIRDRSLHPSTTLATNEGLDTWHRIGFYGMLVLMAIVAFGLYKMRVRVGLLEQEEMNKDGHDEAGGGHSASDGVVRPVALSERP